MAWEWVAPVGTVVVGLGGMTATWLTAKGNRTSQLNALIIQQNYQNEVSLRAERREIYVSFLAKIAFIRYTLLPDAALAIRRLGSDRKLEDPAPEEMRKVYDKIVILVAMLQNVLLIGSKDIGTAAIDEVSEVNKIAGAVNKGEDDSFGDATIHRLREAIRKELYPHEN